MKYLCPPEDLTQINEALRPEFEKLRSKVIFISGATGFIGKNILESILWINEKNNLDLKIFAISRNPNSFFSKYPHFQMHASLELFKADICDKLDSLPIQKIDFVIHAATDVVNQQSPIDILGACVGGTSNILSFAKTRGCQSFLLLSSGAVYGNAPLSAGGLEENQCGGVDLQSPKSAYALGKQLSEWITHQSGADLLQVKVARCFAFVGPYLPLDQHFAIGNFIKSSLLDEDIEIKGDGTPLRTYLYTSDLCVWLIKILVNGLPDTVLNVGGDQALSIEELAYLVKDLINPNIQVKVHQPPNGISDRYIPNINKIASEMDLRPTIQLKEAISKTVDWNMKYAHIK